MKGEGADVTMYVKDRFARKVGEGLINHVDSIEEGVKTKPDVILFDLNGDGAVGDKLRKDGHNVIGGSSFADKMEMDRAYGVQLAKQYGIKTPKTVEFKNIEEALVYIKSNNKPLAIKMDSNAGGEGASYVAKDQKDMLDYISYQKEEGLIEGNTFVLQEVVHGQEVSTEVWFSNGVPCLPSNSTWETKKLLAGELGIRTGCETSVVCHYEGRTSKLADKTVLKIAPLLKYAKYTGAVDVNAIVSDEDKEPYILEFTPRLGYSAIYAYYAMLGMPLSEYFLKISKGAFTIPFKSKWSSSLKLHIPPYPFNSEDPYVSKEAYKPTENIRINGKISKDFIPIDVKKGRKTEFETAGTMGIVGECLGRGKSVIESWKGSKKVFDDIEVPNKGGRYTDGIDDAWKRIMALRKLGYDDIPSPSNQFSSASAGAPNPLGVTSGRGN
jgi:phosphoribosylamine--glycine ligase